MDDGIKVEILRTPIDAAIAQVFVTDPAHGAIDMFIGTVRNTHDGKAVTGITYDVHDTLAEKALKVICAEAQERWPQTRYYVAHYAGDLPVGGVSIVIAVGSPHRSESFEACRFVIEEIKKRAPVWKREHYAESKSAWLPGHSLVAKERIAGIVLAGGKSSRMGQNKALMNFCGKPMVDHMADLLRQAGCADVFIAGEVPGYDFIPDHTAHEGPAAAMLNLLNFLKDRYDRLLFVPVDMPLIQVKSLRNLLDYSGSHYYAAYPLPSCLATGGHDCAADSVRALLAGLGAQALEPLPEWRDAMVNANTREEWEALAS